MKKILHKLTYAQNPSYYEEILCKVLTVRRGEAVGKKAGGERVGGESAGREGV